MAITIRLVFAAVTLGLGWAMRGHFGHEWGASWAGAMGSLAILLVSGRKDWIGRAPSLTALGAVGWAAGGMMSYGIVIGYCRSLSFPNALYGYAMLAVIGGLYGFIGGGLFGLGLESGEEKKPKWASLITQMFAGGFLVWGLLIYQMEWLMTPPRSELWAGCLGAAMALGWFLSRSGFKRALRVAAYSALGAGFGFSFGNFLQTAGSAAGIPYNWWNVMEFTLGFFGGLGMAYAVLTRGWPGSLKPSRTGNWIAILFVFLFIPATNYFNGFTRERFTQLAQNLDIAHAGLYAGQQLLYGGVSVLVFALIALFTWRSCTGGKDRSESYCIPSLLLITSLHYNLFCYLRLGTFYRSFSLAHSDSTYIFILLLLFFAWYFTLRKKDVWPVEVTRDENWKRWGIILAVLGIVILVMAGISVNMHAGLPGAHERF